MYKVALEAAIYGGKNGCRQLTSHFSPLFHFCVL